MIGYDPSYSSSIKNSHDVIEPVDSSITTTNNSNIVKALQIKRKVAVTGSDLIESAVQYLTDKVNFPTIEESWDILYYANGVYVKGGETLIESLAEKDWIWSIKWQG